MIGVSDRSVQFIRLLLKPNNLVLIVLASDGLCCVSGEGYFMLTTGDEVIVDSTGEFGGTSSTTFTLPTDLDPSVLDSLATPSVSISITPSAAPSVTPKKQPNNKPSKEATITPTEGNDPKKENQA
jgi:uncharacterized membrane protein